MKTWIKRSTGKRSLKERHRKEARSEEPGVESKKAGDETKGGVGRVPSDGSLPQEWLSKVKAAADDAVLHLPNQPFQLESGESLPGLIAVAYETYGTLSADRDNASWSPRPHR